MREDPKRLDAFAALRADVRVIKWMAIAVTILMLAIFLGTFVH